MMVNVMSVLSPPPVIVAPRGSARLSEARRETALAMALTDPEIRVLASLVEKEAAVPESYPLSLNALRLACNQSTNRDPVVAYDDRTIENALLTLKSAGLVRFVHPAHGGRTTRYRHTVVERWQLSPAEALVLAALALRGPQSANEVRARIGRLLPAGVGSSVEEMLEALAVRSPEPLAIRLGRRSGERDDRWAAALGGSARRGDAPHDHEDAAAELVLGTGVRANPAVVASRSQHQSDGLAGRVDQLTSAVIELTSRLERLERELGL